MLDTGTRIYNHGDMANIDHFGTITEVRVSQYGTDYQITPDADSDRTEAYWIPTVMVSPEYKGNGLTRIVTEAEYNRWSAERLAMLQAALRR